MAGNETDIIYAMAVGCSSKRYVTGRARGAAIITETTPRSNMTLRQSDMLARYNSVPYSWDYAQAIAVDMTAMLM